MIIRFKKILFLRNGFKLEEIVQYCYPSKLSLDTFSHIRIIISGYEYENEFGFYVSIVMPEEV